VDGTSVYWTTWTGNGSLMKVACNGGTPAALATLSDDRIPHLLAVDAGHVYWTTNDVVNKTPVSGGGTQVLVSNVYHAWESVPFMTTPQSRGRASSNAGCPRRQPHGP
jgi:hypothetical protein